MDFGMLGAAVVMGIAALGSAIGIGIAGQGAIGAWKRCYINNKPAPFILTVFAGAPLTQTIYGFLLMHQLLKLRHPLQPLPAYLQSQTRAMSKVPSSF